MENDSIFRNDAKAIVDGLFEAKIFRDDVTRDQMNATEEYLRFALQSRFDSYQKIEKICKSIEDVKNKKEGHTIN